MATLLHACSATPDQMRKCAQLLLDKGAQLPASHIEVWQSLQCSGLVPWLLDQGVDAAAVDCVTGNTAMHLAASREWDISTLETLLRHNADVNARDRFGFTPLHNACTMPATATFLLEHGADPNLTDGWDSTPLTLAARVSPATVAILLSHNADAFQVIQGRNALTNALEDSVDPESGQVTRDTAAHSAKLIEIHIRNKLAMSYFGVLIRHGTIPRDLRTMLVRCFVCMATAALMAHIGMRHNKRSRE